MATRVTSLELAYDASSGLLDHAACVLGPRPLWSACSSLLVRVVYWRAPPPSSFRSQSTVPSGQRMLGWRGRSPWGKLQRDWRKFPSDVLILGGSGAAGRHFSDLPTVEIDDIVDARILISPCKCRSRPGGRGVLL